MDGAVMSYSEWRGSQTSATLWRVESEATDQVVVPDGAMDLMWFQDQVVVAGPDTLAMAFDRAPNEETWGLRFGPGAAHALLDVSAHELANQRVKLSDVVGSTAASQAAFTDDVAGDLERIVVELCRRADPEGSMFRLASSLDNAARRGLSARDAAIDHGMSERTLRRLSVRWFGYGYKTLAQIHRFQLALHLTQTGLSLAQVASAAGYADQAHFTRESMRFAGETPSALVADA